MDWIKCSERLPDDGHRVMVCRILKFEELDIEILTHDIGRIDGNKRRWQLDSQQWCMLPCEPTIDSGIISHWMELPDLPEKEEK